MDFRQWGLSLDPIEKNDQDNVVDGHSTIITNHNHQTASVFAAAAVFIVVQLHSTNNAHNHAASGYQVVNNEITVR